MTRLAFLARAAVCAAGLLLVAAVPQASADSIGPNCGSCFGSIYTLTDLGLATDTHDGDHDMYRIMLSINTASYTGAGTDYINSVAIKVTDNLETGSLESTTAPGSWTFHIGGLSNGGCNGNGAGFACAQDGTSAKADGHTYTWIFDLDVAPGTLLTGSLDASVKAQYLNSKGGNAGITSEDITLGDAPPTPVPEPVSAALVATGLLFVRRRNSSPR